MKVVSIKRWQAILLAVILCFVTVLPTACTTDTVDHTASTTAVTTVLPASTGTITDGTTTTLSGSSTTAVVTTVNVTTAVVPTVTQGTKPSAPAAIPAYSGSPYVVLNDNIPSFSKTELTTTAYERYSELDSLGRCGTALASCGKEIMPADGEGRGSISSIKPSGWVQATYDSVDGKYLYNRSHLIGWQLSAENANKKNLITGTRYMNTKGMLPFENMIADYIHETGNHVAYRVTPIYKGNDLLPSGVQLEAYSIEDGGEGVCFNVYVYNVQPGIVIDYATGASHLEDSSAATTTAKRTTTTIKKITTATTKRATTTTKDMVVMVWIPQSGSKYHSRSGCSNMKNPSQVSLDEAVNLGYEPCKRCY